MYKYTSELRADELGTGQLFFYIRRYAGRYVGCYAGRYAEVCFTLNCGTLMCLQGCAIAKWLRCVIRK
jgi:hypothetical protein